MKQNRNLNPVELQQANSVLGEVRTRLNALAAGDLELLFALRRKVYKELTYDERGKPAERKRLKRLKYVEQEGNCAICAKSMPSAYSELDRLRASGGYTPSNTRLVHPACHHQSQRERRYT
jgi:hypothetical protein